MKDVQGAFDQLTATRSRRLALIGALSCYSLFVTGRLMANALLRLLLYHPRRYLDDRYHARNMQVLASNLGRLGYAVKQVSYNGGRQQAWLVLPQRPWQNGTALWLFFGGNAMCASDMLEYVYDMLKAQKQHVLAHQQPAFLLVDYPGYGANAGRPSPGSTLRGAVDAVRAALPLLPPRAGPVSLNVLGHSLGSSVGALFAARVRRETDLQEVAVSRLILSAPFVSIEAVSQTLLFGGDARWLRPLLRALLTHRWDTKAWAVEAARGGWDVSVIHGSDDQIVPVWMGSAVAAAVRRVGRPCPFIEAVGMGHNDVLLRASKQYIALMGCFQGPEDSHASLL